MNCKPGEFAFLIRSDSLWKPVGTIVKVNRFTVINGNEEWDVETLDGTFFYARDDDLCAMRGWDLPQGFRDELFDPVWIFGDFPDGKVDTALLGKPKQWRRA